MESNYKVKKENGLLEATYTNDVYDLTITKKADDIGVNMNTSWNNDTKTIMKQLSVDLVGATIRLESLMDFINTCAQQGMIPEEVVNQISTILYGTSDETPKKHM